MYENANIPMMVVTDIPLHTELYGNTTICDLNIKVEMYRGQTAYHHRSQ